MVLECHFSVIALSSRGTVLHTFNAFDRGHCCTLATSKMLNTKQKTKKPLTSVHSTQHNTKKNKESSFQLHQLIQHCIIQKKLKSSFQLQFGISIFSIINQEFSPHGGREERVWSLCKCSDWLFSTQEGALQAPSMARNFLG